VRNPKFVKCLCELEAYFLIARELNPAEWPDVLVIGPPCEACVRKQNRRNYD